MEKNSFVIGFEKRAMSTALVASTAQKGAKIGLSRAAKIGIGAGVVGAAGLGAAALSGGSKKEGNI